MFNTNLFDKEISTTWLGRDLFFFERLNSTNTFAKNLERDSSKHGTIILAENQFKGRGQYKHQWNSDAGANLTFSLIFEPKSGEKLTVLTLAVSLAIIEIIEEQTKKSLRLKWPNDILYNNSKIAGILTETIFNGNKLDRAIVGVGLNVNQILFEESIHGKATSIKKIIGKDVIREILLARILSRIEYYYQLWLTTNAELVKRINKKLIGYGMWIKLLINHQEKEGVFKFLGINEKGQLLVLNKDLEVNIFSYEQVRIQIDSESN